MGLGHWRKLLCQRDDRQVEEVPHVRPHHLWPGNLLGSMALSRQLRMKIASRRFQIVSRLLRLFCRYDYITKELPSVLAESFPDKLDTQVRTQSANCCSWGLVSCGCLQSCQQAGTFRESGVRLHGLMQAPPNIGPAASAATECTHHWALHEQSADMFQQVWKDVT